MDGNLLQTDFFKVFFALFLDLRGVFQVTKVTWGCLYVSGTNRKITPQNQSNSGNFPVLDLIFHLPFPKIWYTYPNKNYIFETINDKAITSQSFAILA